ncbi:DUF6090 family protein [Robiginitalea sp.]|uniref:DUF6090 family protein n=1 Tax=Robiginitalea sp. TaxID=1902411 RepID=UPI003C525D68
MSRLFNQFRRRLLPKNRFSKYLLYTIGEIIIVIFGILIALQVDAWTSERESRAEAQVFLKQLKNEFLANREQLVQKVLMRDKALQSARELLRFVDGESEYNTPSQVDSLLAVALPVYTFDPSLGVLNQLTSTDKLTLLRNEKLNDTLSSWNSMIEDFKEDEDMYNSYNHNHFRPFLYKNYNARNIINSRIRYQVINSILLSSPEEVNDEIGFSGMPVDLDILKNSVEFENYLAFVVSWIALINTQSQGILNYIDSVLEIIDNEIVAE